MCRTRSQRLEADSKSSEGVVIFTGIRVSASSLKCTTQPVRMRSSHGSIPGSGQNRADLSCANPSRPSARRQTLRSLAVFAIAIAAIPALFSTAHAQVVAKPQFSPEAAPQILCPTQVIGNRRIPKESILARLFSRSGDTYDPAVVEALGRVVDRGYPRGT